MKLAFVLSLALAATALPAQAQEEAATTLASSYYSVRCKSGKAGVCAQMQHYLEGQEPGIALTATASETTPPDMIFTKATVYQLECWNKTANACRKVEEHLRRHPPAKR